MVVKSDWLLNLFSKIAGSRVLGMMWIPPFIWVRKDSDKYVINHERVHLLQWLEVFFVSLFLWMPFTLLVFGSPFIGILWAYSTWHVIYLSFYIIWGYKNNPFEKEANANQIYEQRSWFDWIGYI